MSIDDLITLLLVVLFVGAPLLQRILGRGGQQRPGDRSKPVERPGESRGPAPERRSRPAETGSAGGAEASRSETAPSSHPDPVPGGPGSSGGASELERKIEEARRRVQEARQGQGGRPGRSTAGRGAGSARPVPAPLVRPRTEPESFLGREGTAIAAAPAQAGFLGREGVREEPPKKTAPLQVSRRIGSGRRSRLSGARDVVSLKRGDILRGIVWHQILSEPVSARTSRRKPSRVR